VKTHKECMELFAAQSDKYDGAHWRSDVGCCLKPSPNKDLRQNESCPAAFEPLWK
jgi:hypothetical protein